MGTNSIRKWPYGFLDEFWQWEDYQYKPPEISDANELIGSIEYVLAVCKLKDREIEMTLPYGYALADTASMKLDW